MSAPEYPQLVERILQSAANPKISTDIGIEAVLKMAEVANREEIDWAIAGGLAMYLYGSPRLTNNVDLIASRNLSLKPVRNLTFGGSNYVLTIGKYTVPVDWIVRNDGYQKYYRAALKEAITMPNGLRLVTPVWLVILKINAGRQKDLDDIVYLLKEKKLVDRPTVKQKIVETTGEDTWLGILPNFRRLCDLADGTTTEPSKYYDQD